MNTLTPLSAQENKRKTIMQHLRKKQLLSLLRLTKKLYDNQIVEWVQKYVHSLNLKIEPKAAALIPEFLGNDLSKVANELSKLAINTTAGKTITAEDIEKNIGISKDFNSFELTAALGKRDVLKANKIKYCS